MTAPAGARISAYEIWQSISEVVRTVLDIDGIDPAVDMLDQGVTSLAFTRIVARVNEKYDMTVDVMSLEEASIESLSALVTAQINGETSSE